MNEIIEQLEAEISASYIDMISLGWIPADSEAPNRYSENFIDLVLTRLAVFSNLSFGDATRLTFEIKHFLENNPK